MVIKINCQQVFMLMLWIAAPADIRTSFAGLKALMGFRLNFSDLPPGVSRCCTCDQVV